MQRREFIITAGRYVLYGVLGVITAASLKNAGKAPGGTCPPGIYCTNCNLISECTLDKAEEARASAKNEINS